MGSMLVAIIVLVVWFAVSWIEINRLRRVNEMLRERLRMHQHAMDISIRDRD